MKFPPRPALAATGPASILSNSVFPLTFGSKSEPHAPGHAAAIYAPMRSARLQGMIPECHVTEWRLSPARLPLRGASSSSPLRAPGISLEHRPGPTPDEVFTWLVAPGLRPEALDPQL
jgi:hypothetical protein